MTGKRALHHKKVLGVIQKQRQAGIETADSLEEKLSHRQRIAEERAAMHLSKQVHSLIKINEEKFLRGRAVLKKRDEEAKKRIIAIEKKLDAAAKKRSASLSSITQKLFQSSSQRVKCAHTVEKRRKERLDSLYKKAILRMIRAERRKEELQFKQVLKIAEQMQRKLERVAKAVKNSKSIQLSTIEAKLSHAQRRRDHMHFEQMKRIAHRTNLKRLSGVRAMKLAKIKSMRLSETTKVKLDASAKRKNSIIKNRVQSIATLTSSKVQRAKHVLAYQYLERLFLDWKIERKLYEAAVRRDASIIELSEKLIGESVRRRNQQIQAEERFDARVKLLHNNVTKRIAVATERRSNLERLRLCKISSTLQMKRDRIINLHQHNRIESNYLELCIENKVHSAKTRRERNLHARVKQFSYHNCKKLSTCYRVKKSAEKMSRELRESGEAKLAKAAERKGKFLQRIVDKVVSMNKRRASPSSVIYSTPRSPTATLALATLEQRLSDASARRKSLLLQRAERAQKKNRRRNGLLQGRTTGVSVATLPPQCVEPSVTSCGSNNSSNYSKIPSTYSDLSESHPKKLFTETSFGLSISSILTNNQDADMILLHGNDSQQQQKSMFVKSIIDEEENPISPLPSPVEQDLSSGYLCSVM